MRNRRASGIAIAPDQPRRCFDPYRITGSDAHDTDDAGACATSVALKRSACLFAPDGIGVPYQFEIHKDQILAAVGGDLS